MPPRRIRDPSHSPDEPPAAAARLSEVRGGSTPSCPGADPVPAAPGPPAGTCRAASAGGSPQAFYIGEECFRCAARPAPTQCLRCRRPFCGSCKGRGDGYCAVCSPAGQAPAAVAAANPGPPPGPPPPGEPCPTAPDPPGPPADTSGPGPAPGDQPWGAPPGAPSGGGALTYSGNTSWAAAPVSRIAGPPPPLPVGPPPPLGARDLWDRRTVGAGIVAADSISQWSPNDPRLFAPTAALRAVPWTTQLEDLPRPTDFLPADWATAAWHTFLDWKTYAAVWAGCLEKVLICAGVDGDCRLCNSMNAACSQHLLSRSHHRKLWTAAHGCGFDPAVVVDSYHNPAAGITVNVHADLVWQVHRSPYLAHQRTASVPKPPPPAPAGNGAGLRAASANPAALVTAAERYDRGVECGGEEMLVGTAFLALAAVAPDPDVSSLLDDALRLARRAAAGAPATALDRKTNLSLCRAALDALTDGEGRQECPTAALQHWLPLPDLATMGGGQGLFLEDTVAFSGALLLRHAPAPVAWGGAAPEGFSWAAVLWRDPFFLIFSTDLGAPPRVWRLGPTARTLPRARAEAVAYMRPASSCGLRPPTWTPFADGFSFATR